MNIYIFEDITDEVLHRVVKDLAETRDDTVYVYIDSLGGGSGDCDFAIYEALRLSGKKIVTHAVHQIYSAALIIYLAGHERYATNKSEFMIHEAYDELQKVQDDVGPHLQKQIRYDDYDRECEHLKAMRKELQDTTLKYWEFLCANSKLTLDRIIKTLKKEPDRNWFFNVKKAKEFGIVHKIGFPISPEPSKYPPSVSPSVHPPLPKTAP